MHYLVWLKRENKLGTSSDIDYVILTKLLYKKHDLLAYETISNFMIHDLGSDRNSHSSYMHEDCCSKYYLKIFALHTSKKSGFAIYRRKDNNSFIKKGNKIDNRFIILYNRDLIVKYQAHTNVGIHCVITLIKYLFRFINKGPDKERIVLSEGSSDQCADEIKKIFRISLHLPSQNNVEVI